MDDQFYVKRLRPTQATWKDFLHLGEACARGFKNDDLFSYAVGPQFAFGNDHVSVRGIRDPRDRLSQLILRANQYKKLVRGWAKLLMHKCLMDGYDTHVLYKKDPDQLPHQDLAIGLAMWVYPDYMAPELETKLGRDRMLWKLKRWLGEIWLNLSNWWEYGYNGHPVMNERLTSYIGGQNAWFDKRRLTEQQLAQMDYEKLCDASYPENKMVYLSYFVIDSDYQQRGLGSLLMGRSLDFISHIEPEFRSGSSSSIGPQKFYLEASPAGFYLYKKFGFQQLDKYEEIVDGAPIVACYMEMVRKVE